LWLVTEVREGQVFSKQELRAALPRVEQVDRRVRELRQAGWIIETYRDVAGLKPGELRLRKIGRPVWEQDHRSAGIRQFSAATRRQVLERDGHGCVRCGITPGERYSDNPDKVARLTIGHVNPHKHGPASADDLVTECDRCNEPVRHLTGIKADPERVWDQVLELALRDKKDLADWMALDRRPVTKKEHVWALYRQLPGPRRAEIYTRLCQALGRPVQDQHP
jgi:5-methylcytosine-specific restriction endonuclease McrA